jgi:3-deoxy-D-manno-octulosonic-acid transferase
MLIAPRHPQRGPEIASLAKDLSQSCLLRSSLNGKGVESARSDILILDSIGELAHVYGIADLVFMGGSLVPTGGQNVIEAAAFGKPILFGPHMENFREIAKAFTDSYAALQVNSAAELEAKLRDLLDDTHARQWLGRNARKVIRDNQGALNRTLQLITQYLPN